MTAAPTGAGPSQDNRQKRTTAAVPLRLARQLLLAGHEIRSGLQTKSEKAVFAGVGVGLGDIGRRRREDLEGQRQREE